MNAANTLRFHTRAVHWKTVATAMTCLLLGMSGAVQAADNEKESPPTDRERQALLSDLNSDNSKVRTNALKSLAKIGPEAAVALPKLLEILKQSASYERTLAIRCLARIGPDAAESVPTLIDILKSRQSSVWRHEAARALAQMGSAGEAAIPTLIAILGDPNESEKRYLKKVEAPSATGLIAPLLRKDEKGVYTDKRDIMLLYAMGCLASFGSDASDALPAIRRVRDEPDALAAVKEMANKAIKEIQ